VTAVRRGFEDSIAHGAAHPHIIRKQHGDPAERLLIAFAKKGVQVVGEARRIASSVEDSVDIARSRIRYVDRHDRAVGRVMALQHSGRS